MSIKIDKKENRITLKTKNTMYVMQILFDRFPVHLYYGKNSPKADLTYRARNTSYSPNYEEYGFTYVPNAEMVEFPFYGNGDYRADALRLRDMASGSKVTEFIYQKARKFKGRKDIPGLPFADADENTETLELTMTDKFTGCTLKLYYTLFPECDIISRYFTLENGGNGDVRIEKCMSLSLDLPDMNYEMISFCGSHCMERIPQRTPLFRGNQRVESKRGASSHQANPFIMLAANGAKEESGNVYGFNFVYSGSFLDEAETDFNGTTRVAVGLGSDNFSMLLKPGEEFSSPEAIMTFSSSGIGTVSRNMHSFIRSHILPAEKYEKRPVVLNSWEAFYFDIDEDIMIDFAKAAKECGADMLVMDDGWFGKRINDRAGLGDWYENPDRFRDGLAPFADRIHAQGVKFGIWIEPEMVNPDSDLFRAHPDWILLAPRRDPLVARHQHVLDFANPDVLEYIKNILSACFDGVAIDYFKWDMNRHMCSVYSPALPPERQDETAYRYMLGVYELYRWLTERYPNVMIENCSGGGGRYDLGMMKYSTQIWTSDNTTPADRVFIQYGSSFGYPASTMSCHVATGIGSLEDKNKLDFGYRTALAGPLGYEFNALKATDELKKTINAQIDEYRRYEHLILRGDFYRMLNPLECGCSAYCFASDNRSELLFTLLRCGNDSGTDMLKRYTDSLKTGKSRTVPESFRIRFAAAKRNTVYKDMISGECFDGDTLRRGITLNVPQEGLYSKMMYLVEE